MTQRASMPRMRRALAIAGILAGGCSSEERAPYIGEEDSGSSDDSNAIYDYAELEIFEPQSASIHLMSEPVHLLAEVTDPDGFALDVDEVLWVTDDDEPTLWTELEGDVELAPGIYDISAVARLPNGDRLRTTVGGVRVQARWTGVYAGEVVLVIVTTIPGGGPLILTCEGPLDFVVSLDGREAPVEDGECTISVFGQMFDGTYSIEMGIDAAGLAQGTADFAFTTPLGPFEFPIDWVGAFYDNRFSAGLSGTVAVPLVGDAALSGSLQALNVNPYVDP